MTVIATFKNLKTMWKQYIEIAFHLYSDQKRILCADIAIYM